jgi:hypothetical protein
MPITPASDLRSGAGCHQTGIIPAISPLAFSGIMLYAAHLGLLPTLVAIIALPLQFVFVVLLSRFISMEL